MSADRASRTNPHLLWLLRAILRLLCEPVPILICLKKLLQAISYIDVILLI